MIAFGMPKRFRKPNPTNINQPKPTQKKLNSEKVITLNSSNKTLFIGNANTLAKKGEFGTVYTNPKTNQTSIFTGDKKNPDVRDVVAAPTEGYRFILTGEKTATNIKIGSLHLGEQSSKTSIVEADGNDTITLNGNTTISSVKQLEGSNKVSISFMVKKPLSKFSNTVEIIATKEDMQKILKNATGLTPKMLDEKKSELKALGIDMTAKSTEVKPAETASDSSTTGTTKPRVENTDETKPEIAAGGTVSTGVIASVLKSRSALYGKDSDKFKQYKEALEEFYTITESNGNYQVERKGEANSAKPEKKEEVKPFYTDLPPNVA
ncbi:MAG: hypothetical protein H2174_09150 [Vampirovibrio sp.]|nr:hypothetical protein [Vampirovibrio sp.]